MMGVALGCGGASVTGVGNQKTHFAISFIGGWSTTMVIWERR
jgi:hypothetical protein